MPVPKNETGISYTCSIKIIDRHLREITKYVIREHTTHDVLYIKQTIIWR